MGPFYVKIGIIMKFYFSLPTSIKIFLFVFFACFYSYLSWLKYAPNDWVYWLTTIVPYIFLAIIGIKIFKK